MEHLTITRSEFDDITSVCQERGIDVVYSIEDGGEIHIYAPVDIVEDILWASWVVDALELVSEDKIPAAAYG